MGQFLTAVFQMRPTRRKAAALERVRLANEEAFWEFMDSIKETALAIIKLPEKERRTETRRICAQAIKVAIQHKLVEPVAQGMARDAYQSVSSFIELSAGGQNASWPKRNAGQTTIYEEALDEYAAACDKESEDVARDLLALAKKPPSLRPIVFARSRDARIVRNESGRLVVVLNCLWASDTKSRQTKINPGVDPTTGEALMACKSKTKLVIPLSCSKWHENKFLNGRAILRSSLVYRRGERWFIAMQFEMPKQSVHLTGAVLGIDRGVVFTISAAVVDKRGALLDLLEPQGQEIGQTIRASEDKRRRDQWRRGISTLRHNEVLKHSLHRMANDVVRAARRYGAEVAIEKLDDMKRVITTKREKGTTKGGWRSVLKKAQLGKFEIILKYKLALAGLPKVREIAAHGTSQTCSSCGHKAKENRLQREIFQCVSCGHLAHADQNASIIIARRGVLIKTIKKGDKMDALHQNMVASLLTRDDGGLGRCELFAAVVPAHATGAEVYEGEVLPPSDSG